MEKFLLHPDSIVALACGSLCLVLAAYLASLPQRSADGRRLTGFFLLQTGIHLLGFVASAIAPPSPWNAYALRVQGALVALLLPYTLWVVYAYRQTYFPREMRWVVGGSALLMALVWGAEPYPYAWFTPPHVLAAGWGFLVLARKTLRATQPAAGGREPGAPAAGQLARRPAGRQLWQALRRPPTRESRAQRALALWSLSSVVIGLNAALGYVGVTYQHPYWVVVHNALVLVQLVWLIITYLNYAEEATTLLVKLVALLLCLTLFLLGQLGPLLYAEPVAFDPAAVLHQPGLRTLAGLVVLATGFLVVVVPIFLRRNLLRPLRQVLDGVTRVNAGNLAGAVPVFGNDELGLLAQNFNQMTDSLRRYATQMEDLVAQRTAELEHQKEALQRTLGELRATQTQLIQSAKMASLGELTAGIAHEIQNPLNFVTNFADVSTELVDELAENQRQLARDPAEAAELLHDLRQNLGKISLHGRRAAAIVGAMLEHSRASPGPRAPTDLNDLCDEALRLTYQDLRRQDQQFQAELKTDFAPLPALSVAGADVRRVLVNLLANAFYAVRQRQHGGAAGYRPSVTVQTRHRDHHVFIRVLDNGAGMSEAVRHKVFQPFFTTKPPGQGTGLGLSLAHDIITQGHGGTLSVESREGEGTEFIIGLPA